MSFVVFCLLLRNDGICREGIRKKSGAAESRDSGGTYNIRHNTSCRWHKIRSRLSYLSFLLNLLLT